MSTIRSLDDLNKYAASKIGDNTQTFKVADAINSDEAVSKAQMDTQIEAGRVQILSLHYEEPDGTDGIAMTADNYTVVPLNTVIENTIIGASLASNIITLPAGIYSVIGSHATSQNSAISLWCSLFKGTTNILKGQIARHGTYHGQDMSSIIGTINLSTASDITFEGYTEGASTTMGLHSDNAASIEVYGQIIFMKVG